MFIFLKKESNKIVKTEQLPPLDEILLFSETNGHSSGLILGVNVFSCRDGKAK